MNRFFVFLFVLCVAGFASLYGQGVSISGEGAGEGASVRVQGEGALSSDEEVIVESVEGLGLVSPLAGIGGVVNPSVQFPTGVGHEGHDHGEEHHHTMFVGGLVHFWSDLKLDKVHFEFCPEVGFFLNEDWVLGLIAKYEYERHSHGGGERHAHSVMGLSPFVRYYYFHRLPFNLYLDGTLGWSYAWGGHAGGIHGLEVGIRPGACVDLTEGLCLCLRMGFIGYRQDFRAVEHHGHGEAPYSGFGFIFTPEELQIGLELEF